MVVNSASKLELKKQLKFQSLCQAGLDLFREQGFHSTRIEDLAAKANVGKGTFYLYFKNKEDLVISLFDRFRINIRDIFQWVHSKVQVLPIEQVIETEAKELVELLGRERELAKFLFREGRSVSPRLNDEHQEFITELIDLSEMTFSMAKAEGSIEVSSPRLAAVQVVGGVLMTYQLWVEGQLEMSPEEILVKILHFYNQALGIKSPLPMN